MASDNHLQIVLDRYADRENVGVHHVPADLLVSRYLSKIIDPSAFAGKTILEIGAGCSQYVPVFMAAGCKTYFANDLIPERLVPMRADDDRYVEIPGDFMAMDIPEKVDFVFATLTMMFLKPYFKEMAAKIFDSLKPGGEFISMDPNYLCPFNAVRNLAVKGPNPTKLFNPLSYARVFKDAGFVVDRLVPFTGPYPMVTGSWLLGTAFWMRARKP